MFLGELGIKIYEFNPLPADLLDFIPAYPNLLQLKSGLSSLTEAQRQSGDLSLYPRLCLHSKCMLVDNDISFIGSYNLDPRSANLNTELSAVVIDENFNKLLADHIAVDIAARNSWVVAKRKNFIGFKEINSIMVAINNLGRKISSIDLWPRRFTSCFQLNEGAQEVSPDHQDFYKNYHAVGNFPRVKILGEKEILIRFFKAFAKVVKPIL
jgi:phosphatidylserine/phosphatidylglycerophosphate/cardiolipin synthase-like enzyme